MNEILNNIELSLREKKEFFYSFSSLYESGMPVSDIFKSIMNSTKNKKIKYICSSASLGIDKGNSIEDVLYPFSNMIGKAYTVLISAGEKSGKLEDILSNICSNITKQQEIRSSLITALIYPFSIFIASIAVGMLFQFIVIPSFKSVYDDSFSSNTKVIWITGLIKMTLTFLFLLFSTFFAIKHPRLIKTIKNFLSSIFIIRGILKKYYFANFFYIMYLAYEAGISASKSVNIANSIIGIDKINYKIKRAEKMIENGTPISRALNLTGVFPGFAISQITAGEEAGKLDKMFKLVAKDYENQMDTEISAALKILGPIILLIVGIFVAFIIARGYSEYYKSIFSMF